MQQIDYGDIVSVLVALISLSGLAITWLRFKRKDSAEVMFLSQDAWNKSLEAQAEMQRQINELQVGLDHERDMRRALERKLDLSLRTIRGLVVQVKELGGTPYVPDELAKDI